jgi:hypothetical protein
MYWPRLLEKTIAETEKTFQVSIITGPRRSSLVFGTPQKKQL